MKVKLIVNDWFRRKGHYLDSCYNTIDGVELSSGKFHSGTTFDGEIFLDQENEDELKRHLDNGFILSVMVQGSLNS